MEKPFAAIFLSTIVLIAGCAQSQQTKTEKYTNQNAGFEFQKPVAWAVARECKDDCEKARLLLSLTKSTEASINVFAQNSDSSDIEAPLAEFKASLSSIPSIKTIIKSEKEISIAGIKGKHLMIEMVDQKNSSSKAGQEIVAFYKGGKFFVIAATYKSDDVGKEFSAFIESFKFL